MGACSVVWEPLSFPESSSQKYVSNMIIAQSLNCRHLTRTPSETPVQSSHIREQVIDPKKR